MIINSLSLSLSAVKNISVVGASYMGCEGPDQHFGEELIFHSIDLFSVKIKKQNVISCYVPSAGIISLYPDSL